MKTFILACLLAVVAAAHLVVSFETAIPGGRVIIVGDSNIRGR